MRFEELNAEGGVYGRKIRFIVEDTQYQILEQSKQPINLYIETIFLQCCLL